MRTAVEIGDRVRSGAERAVDVVQASLAAITETNPVLNAFVALDAESALEQACEIDRRVAAGDDVGPLAGVPFGVKDLEDLQGFVTTHGSLLHQHDAPAKADSLLVARLRAAGAVPLGKTATPEFGLDSSTYSKIHGVTRNPWNTDLTPGGSSGGSSAAVAGGMTPFATATDGGGSIRGPAAFTGLIGLKPSHGRIPQDDGFSTFSCKGALTTTVADTARFLDVAAGPHGRDRTSLPHPGLLYERAIEEQDVRGLRAVWSRDYGYAVVDDEVADIAEDAANQLIASAGLMRSAVPFKPTNVYEHWGLISLMGLRTELERSGTLPAQRDKLSVQTQYFLDLIDARGIVDTHEAQAAVKKVTREAGDFFAQADLILSPATATAPYAADILIPSEINGVDASKSGIEPFGMMANFCWLPSISIPAGLTLAGLPVGLQITARRHADDVLLRLARILEQDRPWFFPWAGR